MLNDIGDLPKIAADLKDEASKNGIEVIKIDTDKILKPGAWGWRIAAFDLKMPNGQLVEYYCPVKEMEAAKKDGNHQLFEKWRNTDSANLSKDEISSWRADLEKSRNTYGEAWNASLERTKQTPETVKQILEQVHAILERPDIEITLDKSASKGVLKDVSRLAKDHDLTLSDNDRGKVVKWLSNPQDDKAPNKTPITESQEQVRVNSDNSQKLDGKYESERVELHGEGVRISMSKAVSLSFLKDISEFQKQHGLKIDKANIPKVQGWLSEKQAQLKPSMTVTKSPEPSIKPPGFDEGQLPGL